MRPNFISSTKKTLSKRAVLLFAAYSDKKKKKTTHTKKSMTAKWIKMCSNRKATWQTEQMKEKNLLPSHDITISSLGRSKLSNRNILSFFTSLHTPSWKHWNLENIWEKTSSCWRRQHVWEWVKKEGAWEGTWSLGPTNQIQWFWS